MEIIDVLGKPCPIPVIEAKKALAKQGAVGVLVRVDNIVAVQNLEKMAKGYGYGFSYVESLKNVFDVNISMEGESNSIQNPVVSVVKNVDCITTSGSLGDLVVVISKNTMGEGSDELGKILIKGFIYSLTELPVPPEYIIFLNSGVYLTSECSNTISDLKRVEGKGTKILTCGTCVNYYGLQDKLAVGMITDMYGIMEKMAAARKVINI